MFGTTKWVYQQDGATPHTARISQQWCENNLFKFLSKNNWPPNSPDLNPCDFYFWNAVVTRIRCSKFSDLETFKKEILRAIKNVPVCEIKNSLDSFSRRVAMVEKVKGNYCHK